MKLFFQSFPNSNDIRNLIILHGLFGSSKNWFTIAKELSNYVNVFTVDLRNHGNSPHSEDHRLLDMILDIYEFIEDHHLKNVILLGHSMGGLVAMGVSLNYPDKIDKLIVVDIAPKIYTPHHQKEFEVLKTDVSSFQTRNEIEQFLSKIHPDLDIVRFLMMNLVKDPTGYHWKINTKALEKALYLQEVKEFENKQFDKHTLFIKAKDSNYITKEDYVLIKKFFPHAKIKELEGNHWVHYSNAKAFIDIIVKFILFVNKKSFTNFIL